MAISQSQRELDALAAAGLALASAGTLAEALQVVADGAAGAVRTDVVIARAEVEGRATALGIAAASEAVAAELARSGFGVEELPQHEQAELSLMPTGARHAVARAHAPAPLLLPVHVDGRVRGSLELLRAGDRFDDAERRLARLAAGQATLAFRAFGHDQSGQDEMRGDRLLTLVGDALAAGVDESRTAAQLVRFAVDGSRAESALLWNRGEDGALELVAAAGADVLSPPPPPPPHPPPPAPTPLPAP